MPEHTNDNDRSGLSRRGFLAATAAVGAVTAAGLGSASPAAASPAAAPLVGAASAAQAIASSATPTRAAKKWKPDLPSPRFTVAVMPDTQYMFDGASIDPKPLRASLHYLLSEQKHQNIVFLAHLGDLTQNGAANEMAASGAEFDVLDKSGAAYSVLAGNHDIPSSTDDQRGQTPYLDVFGPSRFSGSDSFIGSSADGYNTAHRFTAAGREWLVLALDWRTSAGGIDWARSVLAAHPQSPVILTSHTLVDSNPDGTAAFDDYGQGLWDSFIKGQDQIFLTLNGHYWGPGRTTATNAAGHAVDLHLTNYQNRYYGGAAMIRLYHFDLERNVIDVETLAPFLIDGGLKAPNELAEQEVRLSGDVDRFTMQIDFDERFSGFAPVAVRAPRAAQSMLVSGTIAYWRFDGNANGAGVGSATRVSDLSGHGNDLIVAGRPGAAAGALTWSNAHHPDQPSTGSIAFTGGRPGGDYLKTVDQAPMNSNQFLRGYTVEAFFSLPAAFDSSANGFSALLSQSSSASQAGKAHSSSGDPDEPAVTLSFSGDRELQWCVYPVSQDGSLTNWGHELPLETWWHVAVVNDGKHTTMYVDGCPVARNPSTANHGLAVVGQPWLLGGYNYGGKLDQVFVGSIGDVRLTERALDPTEFMIA
ncbi:LamG-like jellyroll fold domain-containing protein [Agreia sp. COWG]|uniref:LamG-like jellyroll fold domain-containing protein n=1 Tax=Agreia sp. COWG TaxID=2773266 RepID=UPI001AF94D03|nr:LamG-like jellyroll fold domain-containing protein [Agreia sp. COWG]CAD5989987.1 Concanavalin A-like lectin/glucanases superfamily protein [Agreia sp. COWG]